MFHNAKKNKKEAEAKLFPKMLSIYCRSFFKIRTNIKIYKYNVINI